MDQKIKPEERLKKMGIKLRSVGEPVGSFTHCVQINDLLFVSGKIPMKDGNLVYTGKVGENLSVEDAQKAARLCTIEMLSVIKHSIGSLSKIKKIARIVGYIQSSEDFKSQAKVLNGASDFLVSIFGDKVGKHTRSAIGVLSLPLNAAVKLDAIIQVA